MREFHCGKVPFTPFSIDLGFWFIPFAAIVILATVNSVNLTDGLDGLATCITITVAVFFMLFAELGEFPNSAMRFLRQSLLADF